MVSKQIDQENDVQLLALIKKNNQLAFNRLYNKYWKRLFIYTANILNDKELAQDVLHDVFSTLWIKKDELEIESLEKYLFVAAKNKSISQFRKVKFTELDLSIIEKLSLKPEIETNLDFIDLKTVLNEVTQSLPARCREIFYMSKYNYYSNQEIAQHFNISQRTVENQLYLALKHIKHSLKQLILLLLIFSTR
ncbi:RNA polymerase sigma factor [Zunongwangia endophytica]|uniref:RNA polymerase sigma factor n=1 Tax=Zunongwangia endophytica TaxID=1808945 RepID=A0ABV8HAI5_9FLAO|nr:RNA polymerase sigma-70 factor [Zunongwangia endophytica]MDN3593906.1 RNA polymerase sigma-70 factor [Zunongwangia endophytica]